MKKVLIFVAVGEAGTGLTLLIVPSLVGQWLLGEELTGIAIPVARGCASRSFVGPSRSRLACQRAMKLLRDQKTAE
jgi:hypothetical protein